MTKRKIFDLEIKLPESKTLEQICQEIKLEQPRIVYNKLLNDSEINKIVAALGTLDEKENPVIVLDLEQTMTMWNQDRTDAFRKLCEAAKNKVAILNLGQNTISMESFELINQLAKDSSIKTKYYINNCDQFNPSKKLKKENSDEMQDDSNEMIDDKDFDKTPRHRKNKP